MIAVIFLDRVRQLEGPKDLWTRSGSMLPLVSLVILLLGVPAAGQAHRRSERVYATPEIKDGLAKHGLQLVPPPPALPRSFVADDHAFVALSAADFSGKKLFLEESSYCLKKGDPLIWTSQNGEIMLNGKRVFIKGINWYGKCRISTRLCRRHFMRSAAAFHDDIFPRHSTT